MLLRRELETVGALHADHTGIDVRGALKTVGLKDLTVLKDNRRAAVVIHVCSIGEPKELRLAPLLHGDAIRLIPPTVFILNRRSICRRIARLTANVVFRNHAEVHFGRRLEVVRVTDISGCLAEWVSPDFFTALEVAVERIAATARAAPAGALRFLWSLFLILLPGCGSAACGANRLVGTRLFLTGAFPFTVISLARLGLLWLGNFN